MLLSSDEHKRYFVGIDPGFNTGIAVIRSGEKKFKELGTFDFWSAHDLLQQLKLTHARLHVFIEDARMRGGKNNNKILQGVGGVKAHCKLWSLWCERHEINYNLVRPNPSLTKLDKSQFEKITGWSRQTSQHARDAGMLVWGM